MTSIVINLPEWIDDVPVPIDHSDEERMRYVLSLAARNVTEQTGGPFGAAVFGDDGVISAGVNLVVPTNAVIAHAEATALTIAGQRLGSFDLHGMTLITSSEPCVMCFGVIWWSGVSRLVCGARDADVRSIGFDEGPKRPDWADALKTRNVDVVRDFMRHEATQTLSAYAAAGGPIYNGGTPDA